MPAIQVFKTIYSFPDGKIYMEKENFEHTNIILEGDSDVIW